MLININLTGGGTAVGVARGPIMAMTRSSEPLTTAEVADILGVKRQTIYAYVSRGILHRRVALDGRTSLFDRGEVEELRLGRRSAHEGELRTILATALTRVADDGLSIRGQDVIEAVTGGATFVDLVDLTLGATDGDPWPALDAAGADGRLPEQLQTADPSNLLEQLRILVAMAAATDPLRHDLDPRGVRAAGRRIITSMATGLRYRGSQPGPGGQGAALAPSGNTLGTDADGDDPLGLVACLWPRLTDQAPDRDRLLAIDTALALLVDHGLATSTVAARMAASVRADPYSVVIAGLGVLGGPLHGRASGAVHELYESAGRQGAAGALGVLQRRGLPIPGLGHAVYRQQDPRYGALMERIVAAWGGEARLGVVFEVRDLLAARTDKIPNVDLAVGALTYVAAMPATAGEVLFSVGRTAGWLAHALEEYGERPLRFRTRGHYVGPDPGTS